MKKSVFVILVALLLFPVVYADEAPPAPLAPPPVADDIKPDITILEPLDGDIISGDYYVAAIATDDIGVAKVEFVLDGIVLHTSVELTPDGTYEWFFDTTTVDDGLHALVVAPYDAAGNFNDLSTIQIIIDNSGAAAQQGAPAGNPSVMPDLPPFPSDVDQPSVPSAPPVQSAQVPRSAQQAPAIQPQQIPRVEDTGEERVPAVVEDTGSLWMTLLMSFGIIAVVSAALVVGIQKLREPADVPEHIKMYVYANMQQGYPTTSIRSALLQQAWDEKVVDGAFKDAIGRNESNEDN